MTSWHRPTVRIAVSRVTARQIVVIGLVMFINHASGQSSSMSRAMPRKTGMFRSARAIPPGPTVSPTLWAMPYRLGTSRSWRIDANPPVEIVTITKSAPGSAARRSVVVRAVSAIPRERATCSTHSAMSGRGSGSMSCRTISAPWSDGVLATSTSSLGTHW